MSEDTAAEPVKEPVPEPPVLDWDRIVHKNVRSKDRADVGNVDAVDEESIVIITEGARGEYKIPKSEVEAFDGAEVFLKSTISELKKFKV
jgi:hypothetical protein